MWTVNLEHNIFLITATKETKKLLKPVTVMRSKYYFTEVAFTCFISKNL